MATQETLLHKPRKSIPKTFWLVLSLAAIISSSALIISHLNKPISIFHFSSAPNVCEHAVDTNSCLTHVAEVVQGSTLDNTKDHKLSTLISLLTKSTTHIRKAMDTANVIKRRINSPREENALNVCEKLMNLSMERVWDSVLTLTKDNMDSQQDAHTWLSSVLTNHATCLDGLEGTSRAVMENDIQDLIARARSSLAVLVAVLPPKDHDEFIDESLNGDFPSWVTSKDRRLLESSVGDVKANVVVAKDGSGKFKTVAEAVASAPNKGTARYVIYVKKGIYKENVEIASSKTNVMLLGDGMDATIITGSLNYVDGTGTFQTATVAAVGDWFIAQDIGFQNTAGPQKHQAVALRVGSDRSVINRCKIDAFQDTLYAHTNRQFYRDSFITGTIDFIFGDAAVVLQKCKLVARKPMANQNNMVTAQGRIDPNQNTATSIQQCDVIPSTDLKPVIGSVKTYLGRPWKKYSRTVVMQSLLGAHIDPTGWAEWDAASKDFLQTLYYGEYMNSGPGAGTSKRVKWPGYHIINTAEANKFTVAQLIQGNVWLKNTGVAFIAGL
ncbi:putative pectinesterase [Medicago truncatula]|uniref:Pectinesterase n=1 Tax=Medicago truncatula TaxID=3880 RepID=G7KWW4_MEDTR|nr:pectinesterase [Medicago truncatula]AES78914.1 pectinesterase/pectinesterase inhibitor [Medicago truncatula]RHN45665.1 putative pectinesterase [Medicago truncatula]